MVVVGAVDAMWRLMVEKEKTNESKCVSVFVVCVCELSVSLCSASLRKRESEQTKRTYRKRQTSNGDVGATTVLVAASTSACARPKRSSSIERMCVYVRERLSAASTRVAYVASELSAQGEQNFLQRQYSHRRETLESL